MEWIVIELVQVLYLIGRLNTVGAQILISSFFSYIYMYELCNYLCTVGLLCLTFIFNTQCKRDGSCLYLCYMFYVSLLFTKFTNDQNETMSIIV